MRGFQVLPVLAAGLLLATVVAVRGAPPASEQSVAVGQHLRTGFSVPKLFDFELYKKLFNKSYSSLLEHMVRAKYFLSRALRAFVSALRYSRGEQGHFLAINHMSDHVQSELDRMRNRVLEKEAASSRAGEVSTVPTSEESVLMSGVRSGEDVEQFYRALVESLQARKTDPLYARMLEALRALEQPGGDKSRAQEVVNDFVRTSWVSPPNQADIGEALRPVERTKRSVVLTPATAKPRRKLPLDRLINLGADQHLSPKALSKIQTQPKSNNPLYEAPELATMGMVDQQVPVEVSRMQSATRSADHVDVKNIGAFLDNLGQAAHDGTPTTSAPAAQDGVELPDEVFVDLRDSDCMFLPRSQGQCGSCYAFATISLMEYLHCKKTGQLVAFSEQYVVDCGRQYYNASLFGCQGGCTQQMPSYFHNFGLELRSLYPYRMQEDQCPYEASYDLHRAGFIRTDVKMTWQVPVDRFADLLKFTPILLSVNLPADFKEYGGGVHLGECKAELEHHAMLLVGHGREDGQEYWLIRNSHSVGWGEGGYYKLSKKTECIDNGYGWIFGSSDGEMLDLIIKPNHQYDEDLVQEHYFRKISV